MAGQDTRAGAVEQVGRLEGDGFAVGQADALEDDGGFAAAGLQVAGDLGVGGLEFGLEHAILGGEAAAGHVLGKGSQLAQFLVDLGPGDVGALADLALGKAVLLEELEGLASGHARDIIDFGQLALGGQAVADGELAGLDLGMEEFLDLDIEGRRAVWIRLHLYVTSVWYGVVYTISYTS